MMAFQAAIYSFVFFILFELAISDTRVTEEQLEQWEINHKEAFSKCWEYTWWPQFEPFLFCQLFLEEFKILFQMTSKYWKTLRYEKDKINDYMIMRYKILNSWGPKVCRIKCECNVGKYHFIRTSPPGCVALIEVINKRSDGKNVGSIVNVKCSNKFNQLYNDMNEPQKLWEFASPTPIGVLSSGSGEQQEKWMDQHRLTFQGKCWEFIWWPQVKAHYHCPMLVYKFGILSEISDIKHVNAHYENKDNFGIRNNDMFRNVGHLICPIHEQNTEYHFIKTWPPGCVARAEIIEKGLNGEDKYGKIVDVKCDAEFIELYQKE